MWSLFPDTLDRNESIKHFTTLLGTHDLYTYMLSGGQMHIGAFKKKREALDFPQIKIIKERELGDGQVIKKKKKINNYHCTAYISIQEWFVTLVKVKADVHSKESTMSVKYYTLFDL